MDSTLYSSKPILMNNDQESSNDEDEQVRYDNSILEIRHSQAVNGKVPIRIVLDGASGVGKSVLVNCLSTGKFEIEQSTRGIYFRVYHAKINGVKYETLIIDTCGLEIAFYDANMLQYGQADVIIEFFAIDRPETLRQVINVRIPHLFSKFPKKPIVLVGARADLRDTSAQSNLFPLELGPLLAKCVGAVEYLECSSKTNFNVHKVFEEAVRVAIAEKYVNVIEEAHTTLKDKVSGIDSEWAAVLKELKPSQYFLDHSTLEQQLNKVRSDTRTHSRKDMFRVLELDRIELSYGLVGTHYIVRESLPPSCSLWNVPDGSENQIMNCRLFSVTESCENMICEQSPLNFRFFKETCESIVNFLTKTNNPLIIRSLVIVNCSGVLNFSFLDKLTGLEYLVIVNTKVDIDSLTLPAHLHDTMKHLVMQNCGIIKAKDVPPVIGKLRNLQILNVGKNNFKKLPVTLCLLHQLHQLVIDVENVVFPPTMVLRKSSQDVVRYLAAIQEDPVENKEAKLIVVGQEGVGKSTLIKAMKRDLWFTENKPPDKTDGVDISVLHLNNIKCKVYDLAGDVEYLNTHSLFLSSNCLHLAVFDLSQLTVSKSSRSEDHLCRLELWLQTIGSQDPKSSVILVGTHADHPLVSNEIIIRNRKLLTHVLSKYRLTHTTAFQTNPCEECMICNPEKSRGQSECIELLDNPNPHQGEDSHGVDSSLIPHILGNIEVSGTKKYPKSGHRMNLHNMNIKVLKSATASSITNIMKETGTETIPIKWLSFYDKVKKMIISQHDLKCQPVLFLTQVRDLAIEVDIGGKEKVVSMLRFFHSQGTFLWYEELPEMKDIVIMDPQWLSDQLRTLISHSSSVSSISDGVLRLSELPTLWAHISEENRSKLLCLFRSVGLCFKITETEELFPCNLPVGWPDREMWSPLPNRSENQTSLLFVFSYVPPSFFPDLICEVNKKRETFAKGVKPLYYRFHIVYITKSQAFSSKGDDQCQVTTADKDDTCLPTQGSIGLHTVHYELMPYTNSLTVSIRGSCPRSIIPNIRCTLETVKCRRYPGIFYNERLLCPECVLNKVQPPASFKLDCSNEVCSRGHKVGSIEVVLEGKFDSGNSDSSAIGQTGRVVGETLQEHVCPKLFVVLPINLECASLKDRFVYSYLRDGFAVHLLCECPDQWHFVDSPGFRVGKPKQFFEKYGNRVCKALRFLSTISTPFKAAAALDPLCKTGAAVSVGAKSACKELQSLLESYLDKYPHLKSSLGSSKDDVKYLKSSSGLQRSELSRFLEIEAKGHNFGPLVCTYVDKCNQWLWLCEEHNKRFEIVEREAVCE